MTRRAEHTQIGDNWVETDESSHDSIELSQTAKGPYQLTIKLYFESGEGGRAVERAAALRDLVAKRFILTDAPSLTVKVKGETAS